MKPRVKNITTSVVVVIAGLFLVWSSYALTPEPKSESARQMVAYADSLVPVLERYKTNHGSYPCFISDLDVNPQPGLFLRPPQYQATLSGYHLFIENLGGTNMIRYNSSETWHQCTASGSCPSGVFARHCCGQPHYPSCDKYQEKPITKSRDADAIKIDD